MHAPFGISQRFHSIILYEDSIHVQTLYFMSSVVRSELDDELLTVIDWLLGYVEPYMCWVQNASIFTIYCRFSF